jgi:hypothetical protein
LLAAETAAFELTAALALAIGNIANAPVSINESNNVFFIFLTSPSCIKRKQLFRVCATYLEAPAACGVVIYFFWERGRLVRNERATARNSLSKPITTLRVVCGQAVRAPTKTAALSLSRD